MPADPAGAETLFRLRSLVTPHQDLREVYRKVRCSIIAVGSSGARAKPHAAMVEQWSQAICSPGPWRTRIAGLNARAGSDLPKQGHGSRSQFPPTVADPTHATAYSGVK